MISSSDNPFWGPKIPRPGDMIRFTNVLWAWEEDDFRGITGPHAFINDIGFVVQVWTVGMQVRMRILHHTGLHVFSSAINNCHLNLKVEGRPLTG